MIVVSDTSPINYLILVDAVEILPTLFNEVIIPPAVQAELGDPRAPEAVRHWTGSLPRWVRIQKPTRIDPDLRLDPGETEAICLAKELRVSHLLIDERHGTRAAKAAGLQPLSTVAVLKRAADLRLVDLRKTLYRLQTETSFRIAQSVVRHLLGRT